MNSAVKAFYKYLSMLNMRSNRFCKITLLFVLLLNYTSCKKSLVPTVTTIEIADITSNSAICTAIISDLGSGTIIERGVCWSTNNTPTIKDYKAQSGVGVDTFRINITSLNTGAIYYARAYAINKEGTGYGMTISFTTLFADIEGNFYQMITIGTQTWMKENLKTTKFRDGTPISKVTDNTEWNKLGTPLSEKPGYCWYNNDSTSYGQTYGPLYNWYTVETGNLCPTGWHVPTDVEWRTLATNLGGENIAGVSLKEAGTSHWTNPNTATNETDFKALPGGCRYDGGQFNGIGKYGIWWSVTQIDYYNAFVRVMYFDRDYLLRQEYSKRGGFSVRCLRD